MNAFMCAVRAVLLLCWASRMKEGGEGESCAVNSVVAEVEQQKSGRFQRGVAVACFSRVIALLACVVCLKVEGARSPDLSRLVFL